MFRKTTAMLCVLVLMLASLSGLGTALAAETGTTEVTVWLLSWWEKEVERLEREFAEENPGYTAKIELVPINNYTENAATAILGGNSPDVLDLDILFVPTLASRNLLMPLDDFMSRYGLTPDLYSEPIYAAGVMNGQNYAIPNRICPSGLLYNKTMLDAAGVAYPEGNVPFDEFLEMCRKLTIPGKQYGFGIAASKNDPGNVMTSFCPVLFGMGGDFLSEDMTESTLGSPEAVAAIKYWVELYTKEKVVPEGCINYAITKDLFPLAMSQQIAMIPCADGPLVTVDQYAEENGFEWGITMLPGLARASGWTMSIPVSAKNVEGAEVFLNWFTKPEVLSKQTVVVPAVKEAQKMGVWTEPLWQAYYEIDANTKPCPITPAWTQIQTIVIQELQNALQEVSTPEQAAAAMVEQINEIL